MSRHRFIAPSLKLVLLAILLIHVPFSTLAAGDMEELLPPAFCGDGWKIEGKPSFYDRETLSDRINGEAELYFPYGFDRMAAARYAAEKTPDLGIDVEIYRMGSLLDAFGMFANYRQKEGRSLTIGAESNLSGTQLFLYQGRYFVHIQITGSGDAASKTVPDCGRTVASRLPGSKNKPPELSVFERTEFVPGTVRYLPQSLLGYDFLNRGIMTDAVVDGANLQIFLLLDANTESTSAAYDGYRAQLGQKRIETGGKNFSLLEGVDPLYGPVMVFRKGNCLAGALKFSGKKGIRAVLENICR
jgi:hypothetical protein